MSDCKVEVDPGVCKMHTVIKAAQSEDMMHVEISIESDCQMVRAFASNLKPIGAYDEFDLPMVQNPVYLTASDHIKHSACPVPCAVLKATEVAADLGLKRDVLLKIE